MVYLWHLLLFSFLWVKEDYSLNNQGSISYSRTFCKCYRISPWLLEIKKTGLQRLGKIQLRNCGQKGEDFSKVLPKPSRTWTGFGELRAVIAELFLYPCRIPNAEKYTKTILTNHLTLSPALFKVLESQKERLLVEWGQVLTLGFLRATISDPNRSSDKMKWEQGKARHMCWWKKASEKDSAISLILTPFFTRALWKPFISKGIPLQHFMVHDPLSLLLSQWCPHQREASDCALGSVGIMNIYWILTRNQPLPYISHISFNFRIFPWSTFYPHSRLQIRNLRLGGIKWIDQGPTVGGSGVVTRAVSWQKPHSKPRVGKLWLVGQIWPTACFYK